MCKWLREVSASLRRFVMRRRNTTSREYKDHKTLRSDDRKYNHLILIFSHCHKSVPRIDHLFSFHHLVNYHHVVNAHDLFIITALHRHHGSPVDSQHSTWLRDIARVQ